MVSRKLYGISYCKVIDIKGEDHLRKIILQNLMFLNEDIYVCRSSNTHNNMIRLSRH